MNTAVLFSEENPEWGELQSRELYFFIQLGRNLSYFEDNFKDAIEDFFKRHKVITRADMNFEEALWSYLSRNYNKYFFSPAALVEDQPNLKFLADINPIDRLMLLGLLVYKWPIEKIERITASPRSRIYFRSYSLLRKFQSTKLVGLSSQGRECALFDLGLMEHMSEAQTTISLEQHAEKCPRCREIFIFLSGFVSEIRAEFDSLSVPVKVQEFIKVYSKKRDAIPWDRYAKVAFAVVLITVVIMTVKSLPSWGENSKAWKSTWEELFSFVE